jgi:hypothetical protein
VSMVYGWLIKSLSTYLDGVSTISFEFTFFVKYHFADWHFTNCRGIFATSSSQTNPLLNGSTTLSITTLSIKTLNKMTLSIMINKMQHSTLWWALLCSVSFTPSVPYEPFTLSVIILNVVILTMLRTDFFKGNAIFPALKSSLILYIS